MSTSYKSASGISRWLIPSEISLVPVKALSSTKFHRQDQCLISVGGSVYEHISGQKLLGICKVVELAWIFDTQATIVVSCPVLHYKEPPQNSCVPSSQPCASLTHAQTHSLLHSASSWM